MSMSLTSRYSIVFALTLSFLLAGCGGGGDGATTSASGTLYPSNDKSMTWNPPDSFSDDSPLDPESDLGEYAIYLNETGTFSESDLPTAIVSAVDPATGTAVTSFNLMNLSFALSPDVRYYVSMQSISKTGARSGFSAVASFTL